MRENQRYNVKENQTWSVENQKSWRMENQKSWGIENQKSWRMENQKSWGIIGAAAAATKGMGGVGQHLGVALQGFSCLSVPVQGCEPTSSPGSVMSPNTSLK